jgi:hypothetical protein
MPSLRWDNVAKKPWKQMRGKTVPPSGKPLNEHDLRRPAGPTTKSEDFGHLPRCWEICPTFRDVSWGPGAISWRRDRKLQLFPAKFAPRLCGPILATRRLVQLMEANRTVQPANPRRSRCSFQA